MIIKRYRSKGFSHHFLLPVLAILLVGAIGGHIMLRGSSAATATYTVKKCKSTGTILFGAESSCVSVLQSSLNKWGGTSSLNVNGEFDDKTLNAVKAFQKAKKLKAYGIVEQQTWSSLQRYAVTVSLKLPSVQNITYTKVANTPSGLKKAHGKVIDTMQGGTTDGTYFYFAFENPKGGGYIAKYDLSGKLIKTSQLFTVKEIGHANALTYDSSRKQLALSVWRVEGKKSYNRAKVSYVNPTTLEIIKSLWASPEAAVTNLCYSAPTAQYASNGTLYDNNFKLIKKDAYNYGEYTGFYGDKKTLGQGIGCDQNNIYVMRYYPNKTKPRNRIYVFNWSGVLTAVYTIQNLKDEAESVFVLNGQLYMGVNNGTTYKGNKKDNKNDYVIRLNGISAAPQITSQKLSSSPAENVIINTQQTVSNEIVPDEQDTVD